MSYLIKSTALAILFVFLTDCGGTPPVNQTPNLRDYERIKREDENRTRILDDTRRRYSGQTCEDEDDRNHECVDQCRDIYSRRSDRDDCEELPIRQIAVLTELHELLEDPDDDDLREIDLEDLKVYLNISIAAFDKLIGRYSRNEAKEVLFWIAENEDIAELFSDEDDEFKALEELFKEVAGSFSSSTETHEPFLARIDGNDRLMEVTIEEGNEVALEWFQDYIIEKAGGCSGSNDEVSLTCFTVFCKIGDGIDDESREDWLGFEVFEDYIEDIVTEEINGNANPNSNEWDTDEINDAGDVTDFHEELCGNLADL